MEQERQRVKKEAEVLKKTVNAGRAAKSHNPVLDEMKEKRAAVLAITGEFCRQHLNGEYAELAERMAQSLSRKRPSPLATGQARTWAAGIVYALGRINFLFDKTQTPHLSAAELCKRMGVSQASASAKSKVIMDRMNLMQLDPRWCLPSKLEDNILVWLVPLSNGMIADVRELPREVQEEAFQAGMIPYIPADRPADRNP